MPLPTIEPPLINSSTPWATSREDLHKLFDCPFTGAVTTRTSLLHGFEHDENIHQYIFFNSGTLSVKAGEHNENVSADYGASLNTLGYSPIPLGLYLSMIEKVLADSSPSNEQRHSKPIIISVTGSAEAARECYAHIQAAQANITNPLCMEINLSCPNIPRKPPPAYSGSSLAEYLNVLADASAATNARRVAIGIKTPPYTYHDQFRTLIDALLAVSKPRCPIDFITSTNTLGSSFVLAESGHPAINSASGAGIGGMAGAPLHPLALGNVRTIREMLDEHNSLRDIDVIGIGGVSDAAGFRRMRSVGAKVVGVGTALGREGVAVFEKILSATGM